MNEIRYPSVKTYYICFDNLRTEVKDYGYVETNQVFTTKWIFDEFIDEAEWLTELANWGITPEFDEEGNLIS